MKLFDERGKLFGFINILDLFLIIILLGALAFAGMKFLQSDQSTNVGQANKQTVEYVLFNSNSHPFVLDKVNIGDTIRDADTNVVLGKIVAMERDQATDLVTTADGKMIKSPVPNKEQVLLTIEAEANVVDGVASLGSIQLLVGNQLSVKGPEYIFPVLISNVSIGE